MNKIAKYATEKKWGPTRLGMFLGVSRSYASRIMNDQTPVNPDLALRMELATKVHWSSWIDAEQMPKIGKPNL